MKLRITQLRKKQDVTQKRLAKLCTTTQQQIAKIENGHVDLKLSTLNRLAEALKCEVKDLFYSKPQRNSFCAPLLVFNQN
jgi:predicted transcriptional regulator